MHCKTTKTYVANKTASLSEHQMHKFNRVGKKIVEKFLLHVSKFRFSVLNIWCVENDKNKNVPLKRHYSTSKF